MDIDDGISLGHLPISPHRAHKRHLLRPRQVLLIKDNIAVAGMPLTCGTNARNDVVPQEDAEAVRRLRAKGCWVVGKSNMDEYSYGASGNNAHFGPIRNPLAEDRSPGGSSGGSAAAVLAGFCGAAIGSDTGGSLRIPAALTGTVAFRPAVGRVPTEGMWAGGPSFDTIGAITRNVSDCRELSMILSNVQPLKNKLKPLRLGFVTGYLLDSADEDVRLAVQKGRRRLSQFGEVQMIELPLAEDAARALGIITRLEAFRANESELDRAPGLFGTEVRTRIESGRTVTDADLSRAREVQMRWTASVEEMFRRVDVIIGPTVPCVAPVRSPGTMIVQTAKLTSFTAPWSLAGVPVLAMPCGQGEDGLPVSLQFVAPVGREAVLFDLAVAFEAGSDIPSDQAMLAALDNHSMSAH